MILPLYSVQVKPHLEHCIQMWSPQYRTDTHVLEHVQRKARKMIQGMKHLSYEDKLKGLGLFSLEKRRLGSDLIVAFQNLKGGATGKKRTDSLLSLETFKEKLDQALI